MKPDFKSSANNLYPRKLNNKPDTSFTDIKMDNEECSTDLQLCLEEEEEKVVVKHEDVMQISGDNEETTQMIPDHTDTSRSPCKKKAKEDVFTENSTTHELERIEGAKETVEIEGEAGNRNIVKKKDAKLYPCQRCGLVSGSSANLKKHIMTHTGEKPFKCRSCLKTFRQRHHLVDHWRIHSGERPFVCEVCNKQFVQKSSLNLHKKKHSGTKAFSCTECDYATYQKTHLGIHMRIHTGEKPYQCEKCGQTFSSSTRLKFHRMIHTGERPYKCEQCGVPFREKVTLQAHMAVHLNVGPFVCEECGQEFSRLAGLSLHRRVHVNKDDYLYVHNKEANRSFNSALQKASHKVNLLKNKRAEEIEKMKSQSVERSDTDDAREVDEPATSTSGQDMTETVMPDIHQTSFTVAKAHPSLSLSTGKKAALESKLPWGSGDSDQHKLKENLASSLQNNDKNSDVNPDQVREALERGTILETQSNSGNGFFIVLPPALQSKDIMVLSDPYESTRTADVHIPDSSVAKEKKNLSQNISSKPILESDKEPNPTSEEEVQDCDMDLGGMEEEVCSEDEGEIPPPEADSVGCMLNTSGPDDVLGSSGEYSEAIEKQLYPEGTLHLQWKENSSSKFTKVTYIIEEGKELVIITEKDCSIPLQDASPAGKAKKRKLKGSENIQKKSEKYNRPEFWKYANILKKCRITKARTQKVYNCEHCGKTWKNSSNYNAHLRIHSGERPYFCGICRMGFKQISHLKSHVRVHTGERPYVCNLCNAAFTQSSRLNAHKRNVHPNGRVKIKERKKKYVPGKRIQNFFCRHCNKTFIGECLKIDHMKLHQPLCPFSCRICGMQFKSKSTMVNHVLKHSDFKHICELCGLELLSLDELQKHKATEHGNNVPNGDLVNKCISVKIGEENNFMVVNPAIQGDKESELGTKIKTESSEDPDSVFCEIKQEIIHVSDVDGSLKSEVEEVISAQEEGEVAIHDITHLSPEKVKNETPEREDSYLAVKPPKKRSDSQNDIQEIIREGEIKEKKFITYRDTAGKKMWVCKVCDRSFTQSSNLYCHMRMHTGDKPYLCNVCPKAFRQITHLKDHMRRHTGAKPHKCSACGKCFTQRSAARRHIMVMHGGEAVTERIPEKEMAKEIINTLSSENSQHSRGEKKAMLESEEATLQADEKSRKLENEEKILHTCKVCKKQFTHSASLGTHSRRCGKVRNKKLPPEKEKCCKCRESFMSHTQLVKHQETCSAVCNEMSCVKNTSEEYKRKTASRSDCEKDSSRNSETKEHNKKKSSHSKTHVNHNSFPCRECGEVFSSIRLLKAHMDSHSGEVHQLCTMCGETFKRASALRYHQSMKHGREDRRYKDYCSTGYVALKEDDTEKMGMEKVHLNESESEYEETDNSSGEEEEIISDVEVNTKISPKKKKTNSCETKRERTKQGSLNSVSNETEKVTRNPKNSSKDCIGRTEKYICTACGVAFNRSSKLKHHKVMWCRRQHETHNTDGKPLKHHAPSKVNKGNKKLENKKESLRRKEHEKSNSSSVILQEGLNYESDTAATSVAVDGKDNAEQSDLELHCKDCDKHFPNKHSLNEHVPIHDTDRPFKCQYCSLGFKRKPHLFNHFRRHVSLAEMECL